MKIVSLVSLVAFAALTFAASPALAVRNGVELTITDVTVYGSNARIYFETGVAGSTPGCTTAARNKHFAINVSTNKGKAQLSLATAALLSGKTVNVLGLDTCLTVESTGWQELDQITINR
jgi:hypothetical protein